MIHALFAMMLLSRLLWCYQWHGMIHNTLNVKKESSMKNSITAFILGIMIMSASQSSYALYGNAGIGDSWWQSSNAYQNNIDENRRYYQKLKESNGSKSTSKSSSKSSSKASSKSGTKTSSKSTSQTKKSTKAYRYTHSASITRQVNDEMIGVLRSQIQRNGMLNAQIEQELKQLKNADLVGKVRKALSAEGYDTNSIATAMAYYLVMNYAVATQADASTLKAHTFVKQLEDTMAEDGSLANMSNTDKQRMADMLYWGGSLIIAKYSEAQRTGNRAHLNTVIKEANYTLSQMGLSTSQLKNGANGLELR